MVDLGGGCSFLSARYPVGSWVGTPPPLMSEATQRPGGRSALAVQGYLAHKKTHPPRTLP